MTHRLDVTSTDRSQPFSASGDGNEHWAKCRLDRGLGRCPDAPTVSVGTTAPGCRAGDSAVLCVGFEQRPRLDHHGLVRGRTRREPIPRPAGLGADVRNRSADDNGGQPTTPEGTAGACNRDGDLRGVAADGSSEAHRWATQLASPSVRWFVAASPGSTELVVTVVAVGEPVPVAPEPGTALIPAMWQATSTSPTPDAVSCQSAGAPGRSCRCRTCRS